MRLARARAAAVAAALCALASVAEATSQTTQTFTLNPGWNAIYLEVADDGATPASIFQSGSCAIPVLSVWTWVPRTSAVDFIQDPGDGLVNRDGWLGWFPSGPEAALTNLHLILPNRPYLVHLGPGGTVSCAVTGRPSLRETKWTPNSFNLAGFPVETAAPPTFSALFTGSPAHAGQPIFRLDASGFWNVIPSSTLVQRGEAYWIFTSGPSDFTSPVGVKVPDSDQLDFGESVPEHELKLTNRSTTSATFRLRLLSSDVPLLQWRFAPTGEDPWITFPDPRGVTLAPGEEGSVRVSPRRASLTSAVGEAVVEISDGRGSRRLMPVRVVQTGTTLVPVTFRGGVTQMAPLAPANPMAGLWVGTVTVRAVSQSQTFDVTGNQTGGTIPTPVRPNGEFAWRVLMHVDDSNQAVLLKEIVQLWKDGVSGGDGHYVLVNKDALIPLFKGISLRDGEDIGRRITAIAYDIEDDLANPNDDPDAMPFTGALTGSGTGTLSVTLKLSKDAPTNPFRHKYHPDHNNIDPLGAPSLVPEAYPIKRVMTFEFTADSPIGPNPPQWGSSIIGGNFSETFEPVYEQVIVTLPGGGSLTLNHLKEGMHKNPIFVEGTFEMRRVLTTPALNQ